MADPVWVLLMFDLPVKTREQRRRASKYRHMLLETGFSMVQLSVYSKYLINATGLRSILPQIKSEIPKNGAVRVMRLTDEQWAATYRYYGPIETSNELVPDQLALFADEPEQDGDEKTRIGSSSASRKSDFP